MLVPWTNNKNNWCTYYVLGIYEGTRERSSNKKGQTVSTNNLESCEQVQGYENIDHVYVTLSRVAVVIISVLGIYHVGVLQNLVDDTYSYLLSTWVFNCVYFETFFATFCYAVVIVYPWGIDKIKCLDRYKVHPSVQYQHVTISFIVQQAILYMLPLMALDTVMVKKYGGVGIDPEVWVEKRESILQTTRALPLEPPTVLAVVCQLFASFVLYDALFFAFHLLLHKNFYLYKYIHKYHHDHEMLHGHVTNQLTIIERISLVLTANFALKVFNSHPFTRTVFVPIFVTILVENHTGYDLPFGYHRTVPFGLVGGSVKHFQHHVNGKRCYQPIFTYLDKLYDNYWNKKTVWCVDEDVICVKDIHVHIHT